MGHRLIIITGGIEERMRVPDLLSIPVALKVGQWGPDFLSTPGAVKRRQGGPELLSTPGALKVGQGAQIYYQYQGH